MFSAEYRPSTRSTGVAVVASSLCLLTAQLTRSGLLVGGRDVSGPTQPEADAR